MNKAKVYSQIHKVSEGDAIGSSSIRDTMDIHSGIKIITAKYGREIIDCRIYVSKKAGMYGYQFACALWVDPLKNWGRATTFTGRTSGCGYDKISSAISSAFYNLGIIGDKMFSDFSGAGERTAEERLEELVKCITKSKTYTVKFYG